MQENSIVYEKAFKFSVRIVGLFQFLQERNEYVMSKQILRSGTSVGANIKEAIYAQTKKDFAYKMNIALKESAETEYWLELLRETDFISEKMFKSLNDDNSEIIRILISSVKTASKNQ
ncbi:MAG: four helix bundle protein [Neofamilia sp.]